ncbi:unnamed protein product, partial [Coregonus sp. 'balchen']
MDVVVLFRLTWTCFSTPSPSPEVILVTRKSYGFCANPDEPLIKKIVKSIDDSKFKKPLPWKKASLNMSMSS